MGSISFSSKCSLSGVTIFIFLSTTFVSGTHFRGGVITWRPATNIPPAPGSFRTVLFNYRVAFRRSFITNDHFCDQQTIDDGIRNVGEGLLECDNGCTTLNDDFDYQCTDFSAEGDWTTGVGESTFTPTGNVFEVFYEGRDWIALENGGNGPWILRSRVNLTPRADNGLLNSSPTTANMPIVRIQLNCPTTLRIPVTDPDGDVVRCRFAVASGDECGTICGRLDAFLDEVTCTLEWTPNETGLFGVAIQIEDFVDASSTTPLSGIPLQFLFEVFEGDESCAEAPVFLPVVLAGQSCIAVRPGDTFTTRIEAEVSDPSRSVASINTVSPIGLTTTAVQQVPGSDVRYFADVSFTSPSTLQQEEIFCFVAEDSGGLTSEQRCIFLVTSTPPPVPLEATVDGNNLLTISVDTAITRPQTPRFIRIISASNQQTLFTFDTSSATDVTFPVASTTLQIQLPSGLPAADIYQVSFDRGAIETNDFCGVENEPITIPIVTRGGAVPCPQDIFVFVPDGQSLAAVSWLPPNPGGGAELVAGPSESQGFYPAGTNMTILYIHRIQPNIYEKCQFSVVVGPDPHPCPSNILVSVLRGFGGSIVTWMEPAVGDQIFSRSHPPGSFFSSGVTCVSYTYASQQRSIDACSFEVEVLEVSPCDSYPCRNNGTCLATSVDTFRCVCAESCYVGDFCEIPIHSCVNNNCMNGGVCQLFGDSCIVSTCSCPPCYTGALCETFFDPCRNNDCQNGGVCTVSNGTCDYYNCECEECFFGVYCENEVPNPCLSDPCLTGFTCTRAADNCFGYTCMPMTNNLDFSRCSQGANSVSVRDRCVSSPCQNDATCISTSPPDSDFFGYTCLCPAGYAGRQCGDAIADFPQLSACTPTSCSNFGTCYNSYSSYNDDPASPEYTCVCLPGFSGTDCSLPPIGINTPCFATGIGGCQNGGLCQNIFISPRNDANFFCDCPNGFAGSRCNLQAQDPCVSAPCRNGGSCERDGRSFRCICPILYTGSACETVLSDPELPLVLSCPQPIILNSDVPVAVQWTFPFALDVTFSEVLRPVSANAAPGAVYSPGQLAEVEIVYESLSGGRSTCAFWIYVNPSPSQ